MPDMNAAIGALIGRDAYSSQPTKTEKLPRDKVRRYTRSKPIGDDDRPIDQTASLRLHRANRTQTIATTIGAIKARLIDVCEIPNDLSSIDVYLDDIDGESGSSPARLNRTGQDFQSVTGGKRENAIAANRKVGVPILKEPGFIIDRAMVRSVKITTTRGVSYFAIQSIETLRPVSIEEQNNRSKIRTKRAVKRAVNKKTVPIPLKDINGRSRLFDPLLGDCFVSVDSRSKRVIIDVVNGWEYYAYIGVSPVINYFWYSQEYPDVARYFNLIEGRTIGDRAIDRDHSQIQAIANLKTLSLPKKYAEYEIINTGTRVYAVNKSHSTTLCELKESDVGHAIKIDRKLYKGDGTIATITVSSGFWANLTKIVNGLHKTIANSDRKDREKIKKRTKTIAATIAYLPECATLSDLDRNMIAGHMYTHILGSGRLWKDIEDPNNGLVTICSKARSGDRNAIAFLRNILAIVTK
jgi:hypothetical protein